MTGDFRLIDDIFDLSSNPIVCLKNTWKIEFLEVYNSLNGKVQAFLYIMSSFAIRKK